MTTHDAAQATARDAAELARLRADLDEANRRIQQSEKICFDMAVTEDARTKVREAELAAEVSLREATEETLRIERERHVETAKERDIYRDFATEMDRWDRRVAATFAPVLPDHMRQRLNATLAATERES